MPDLPTISLTQAQADRALLAFPADPANGLTSTDVYRKWLRKAVVKYVIEQEAKQMDIDSDAAKVAALTALREEMAE